MRLLVVEDSSLLRKMFGLAFPQQFHELGLGVAAVVKKPWTPHKLRLLVEQIVVNPPTG